MTKSEKAKLDRRQFIDIETCSKNCPYIRYENDNTYCKLYEQKTLVTEYRVVDCVTDMIPDITLKFLKEMQKDIAYVKRKIK
jgi:hypothetical protein